MPCCEPDLSKKKGGLTALPGSTKARWQFGKQSDCEGPEAVAIKQYVPVTHTSHNDNDDKQQYKDQNQSTNKQSQNSKVKASMTNGQASSRIETRLVHIIVECMHVCWVKHIQSQLNHTHTFSLIYLQYYGMNINGIYGFYLHHSIFISSFNEKSCWSIPLNKSRQVALLEELEDLFRHLKAWRYMKTY